MLQVLALGLVNMTSRGVKLTLSGNGGPGSGHVTLDMKGFTSSGDDDHLKWEFHWKLSGLQYVKIGSKRLPSRIISDNYAAWEKVVVASGLASARHIGVSLCSNDRHKDMDPDIVANSEQ